MKWWPFGRNDRGVVCECEEDGREATDEYLESLPDCIRNDKERLRRAKRIDGLEEATHKMVDSQILQLRLIRQRLAEIKK